MMENLSHSQAESQRHAEKVSQLELHLTQEMSGFRQMQAEREKLLLSISTLKDKLEASRSEGDSMKEELNSVKRDVSDLQQLRRTERSELERQLAETKEELGHIAEEGQKRHIE